MKTINEIHSDLMIFRDLSSKQSCELIGKWCGRTDHAVYKWLKKPPNEMVIGHVNRKYQEYMGEDDE